MKLVVFGANGPTGRRTTELAAARGHEVTAVTLRPAEFPVRHAVTVYSQGAANIIQAAKKHALRRLVAVTSMATLNESAPGETWFFRTVMDPILLRMGRTVYADMARMERTMADSGLDWTVIRPAGLFDGKVVTGYRFVTEHPAGRFTSRTDLADALVRTATEELHIGQCVNVVTNEGAPRSCGCSSVRPCTSGTD